MSVLSWNIEIRYHLVVTSYGEEHARKKQVFPYLGASIKILFYDRSDLRCLDSSHVYEHIRASAKSYQLPLLEHHVLDVAVSAIDSDKVVKRFYIIRQR